MTKKCIYCGDDLINDEGYVTIARCMNKNCEQYNVPMSVR